MNHYPSGNRVVILRKQRNHLLLYALPALVFYIYLSENWSKQEDNFFCNSDFDANATIT